MGMIINIHLNKIEVELAHIVAKKRYEADRKHGIAKRDAGPEPWPSSELNGAGAEIAVARHFNVYPDLSFEIRIGGCDLIYRELKLEVKATKYPCGCLIAQRWKKAEDSDVHISCVGTIPDYAIVGWVYSCNLICEERLTEKLGHGPTYVIEQSKLRSLENLEEAIAQCAKPESVHSEFALKGLI